MTYKPTILVDFDGVIHQYSRGWADGTAYDPPMPGAKEALQRMTDEGYEVIIFSTRDWEDIGDWLQKWGFPDYFVTNTKRPAVALIDDRAIRFLDWGQAIADLYTHYPIKKATENE